MAESTEERYVALALADCAVLIAGVGVEPLTEREQRIIRHTVSLMCAIAHNLHAENAALRQRLEDCDCDDPPGMAVVA